MSTFFDYLNDSVCSALAADESAALLLASGFREVREDESWPADSGSEYFVRRANGGVVAVRQGNVSPAEAGFRVVAAHTDSPAFKLKSEGLHRKAGGTYVPVEVYGGPIRSTWLDRELVLTGRAVVRTDAGGLTPRHFRTKKPCAIITNLAIHLNREVNKGFEYNAQDHLQVRLSISGSDSLRKANSDAGNVPNDASEKAEFWALIASELNCSVDSIVAADIFAADTAGATLLSDEETIVSGRLDNLAGCYSSLQAFLQATPGDATQILALFDNEEIGSRTAAGADSGFLESVLSRLVPGNVVEWAKAGRRSLLVSNDGAHALHDSYAAKYDPDYAPVLGGGPVLKTNAQYRYASTTDGMAVVLETAKRNEIQVQYLAGRSDMRTGSTIGPFSWSRTGFCTIDLGIPMMAMHSIRETANMTDIRDLTALLTPLLELSVEMLPAP